MGSSAQVIHKRDGKDFTGRHFAIQSTTFDSSLVSAKLVDHCFNTDSKVTTFNVAGTSVDIQFYQPAKGMALNKKE